VILENKTIKLQRGWIFFYQDKRFVITSNPQFRIYTNVPYLITLLGKMHPLSHRIPVNVYIDYFAKHGDVNDDDILKERGEQ